MKKVLRFEGHGLEPYEYGEWIQYEDYLTKVAELEAENEELEDDFSWLQRNLSKIETQEWAPGRRDFWLKGKKDLFPSLQKLVRTNRAEEEKQ